MKIAVTICLMIISTTITWGKYVIDDRVMMDCEDIDTTICINDVFVFEMDTFCLAGSYQLTSPNCEGTFTLNLTIEVPDITLFGDAFFCESDLPVSFPTGNPCNSGIITTPGTYVLRFTDEGCTESSELLVVVTPDQDTTFETVIICEGETFLWEEDGNEYSESGTYESEPIIFDCNLQVLNLNVIPIGDGSIVVTDIIGDVPYFWKFSGKTYDAPGTYTEESISGNCVATLILELSTSVISLPIDRISVSLSPNPTRDIVTLTLDNDGSDFQSSLISIYNDQGQLLTTRRSSQINIQFDIADYPAGVYIVKVQVGNQVVSRKLVVM